ncbi:HD-ZIP IV family of homeobox-leucine zipper protein with lipid-binding START domain-containing protein [Actinidia rufa]|uniref:HD-ZIP IV family of homeobox-leucine zipper protein with lipid-binding START domain-containing protein n=1 Tax=Actinidia rufa TaxID=165716 RepID=A0A7J0GB61_9ERIC|nr:HD-ZIP IV family of homeobox-leucine zipper protein with lipid-binding START domain-containing protein [Actinidia rufa]
MGVDMSNPPASRTKDYFASPALSLSGDFSRWSCCGGEHGGEEGDEGSGGGAGRREETVEISSENSGHARSRSVEEDFDGDGENDGDEDGDGDKNKKKKRKKYHRHTAEQIREMEALFKESPHPDEKQRQQLSKQLGLAPRQVKFWFQNRRTQIKAIQERHENSLLKTEMDKLRDENKSLRETIKKSACPNCGFATSSRDSSVATEEQQLRIENARLKSEIEKLRAAVGKYPPGTSPTNSSCSAGNDQENRSSLDFYTGIFGLEKTRIMEIVHQSMEELKKMATAGNPLWVRSVETGREILNYDEYVREFSIDNSSNGRPKRSIEASRETGVVFVDLPRLVQSFMDVNQWVEMFPCMISKAATVAVISPGEGPNKNGAVQLVIWVEHLECQKSIIPTMYRAIVNSGLAFGARHWIATLQQQCERLVFFMATNVPTKDSSGVATLAGRKSILKLAQRMTWGFCRALGASSYHTWSKVLSKTGDDIRVASRKNLNDPGEPLGVIVCAVSSVWLPISHHVLFDFLRDETRRNEWDIMSNGGPVQSIANLAKGQDRGNAVTIQATKSKESSMWILQDSCTNAYESMVVYAAVDITGMQSVITGCDASSIAILPYGFSILPDGLESRPLVITSQPEEKSTEGGSLLTIAFQILTNTSPTAKLTLDSVESVNSIISCTLQKIKTSLQCEDG